MTVMAEGNGTERERGGMKERRVTGDSPSYS